MIENCSDGTFNVICDLCDYEKNYDTDYSFNQLIQELKDDGWYNVLEKNEWKHYCCRCTSNGESDS